MTARLALGLGVQLDAGDDPDDILEVLTWVPFAAGEYPCSTGLRLPLVRLEATIVRVVARTEALAAEVTTTAGACSSSRTATS